MTGKYDAIVIGGGPSGSTVAARLAQRARRVLLLEKERFPRFHIGESLLPCSMLESAAVESRAPRATSAWDRRKAVRRTVTARPNSSFSSGSCAWSSIPSSRSFTGYPIDSRPNFRA